MQIVKKLALVLVGSAFVVGGLAACGEKSQETQAKDAVDDAAKSAKDAIDKAGK